MLFSLRWIRLKQLLLLSYYYRCSFDQVMMSTHSLTARGSDRDLPFHTRATTKSERGYYCAWAEYICSKNWFRRYYAWADHYLQTVICRSRSGLPANENGGKIHRMIITLICCARRSLRVTLITVFVCIVAWKQARWPPLFITFLISPCRVTSTYQVSS